MYYDESTRRLNLLSGLVFGAALGAGLALLFLPEERLQGGGRLVVRAARKLGRDVREAADDVADSPAAKRAKRLAKRKFEL